MTQREEAALGSAGRLTPQTREAGSSDSHMMRAVGQHNTLLHATARSRNLCSTSCSNSDGVLNRPVAGGPAPWLHIAMPISITASTRPQPSRAPDTASSDLIDAPPVRQWWRRQPDNSGDAVVRGVAAAVSEVAG